MTAQTVIEIELDSKLNDDPRHLEVFQSQERGVVFYGGAGAGKTYTVCDKIILECLSLNWYKVIVVRKTMPSLKKTCLEILRNRLTEFGLPFEENKSEHWIKIGIAMIQFLSVNDIRDYEKVKSITDVDACWIEEANEITRDAYEHLNMRLRGGKGKYKQMIITFNPIGTTNWIYDYHFVRNLDNTIKVRVNAENNKFVEESYKQSLRDLIHKNKSKYDIYYLGEWGILEGQIYSNWDIVSQLPNDLSYSEYGGQDFGFTVDPSTFILCLQKEDDIYLEEKFYRTHMTNQDIVNQYKSNLISSTLPIYADSAEPKTIEEISKAGFNIHPYAKGADSVNFGIDFIQGKRLHIVDGSINLLKEINSYCWMKDRNGKTLIKPVDFDNHAMDAMRYGIHGHAKVKRYSHNVGVI